MIASSTNEEMMNQPIEQTIANNMVPASQPGRLFASSRLISALGIAFATGLALLFSVTSAQAIYVDLDHAAAATGRHVMEDLGIVVHTEKVSEEYKVGLFGGDTGVIEKTIYTIEFTDGPVMLNSVDLNQIGAKAVLVGPEGENVIRHAAAGGRTLVEKIEMKSWEFAGAPTLSAKKLGIDIDFLPSATQPIPEPGAALLFAAGLMAVAATRRR